MKVGVISDTHDNLLKIDRAIEVFRAQQVEAVLHAGDFVSPFAVRRLLEGLNVPLYGVFGNNDGDRWLLKSLLGERVYQSFALLEFGPYKVFLTHDLPERSHGLFEGGSVRAVVFGHTHTPYLKEEKGVIFLNPGEACGWLTGKATIALLDLRGQKAEIIQI